MELSSILEDHDFSRVVEYSGRTGTTLSRWELEDICQQAIGTPTPLANAKSLVHTSDDKWFLVIYILRADKFLYEKLTVR